MRQAGRKKECLFLKLNNEMTNILIKYSNLFIIEITVANFV